MKLSISEPDEWHTGPLLVFDEDMNDVAEFVDLGADIADAIRALPLSIPRNDRGSPDNG